MEFLSAAWGKVAGVVTALLVATGLVAAPVQPVPEAAPAAQPERVEEQAPAPVKPLTWEVFETEGFGAFSIEYPGHWFFAKHKGGAQFSDDPAVDVGPLTPDAGGLDRSINVIRYNTPLPLDEYFKTEWWAGLSTVEKTEKRLPSGAKAVVVKGRDAEGKYRMYAYIPSWRAIYLFEGTLQHERDREKVEPIFDRMLQSFTLTAPDYPTRLVSRVRESVDPVTGLLRIESNTLYEDNLRVGTVQLRVPEGMQINPTIYGFFISGYEGDTLLVERAEEIYIGDQF